MRSYRRDRVQGRLVLAKSGRLKLGYIIGLSSTTVR